MDTAAARKRLEETRAELDRSIMVLGRDIAGAQQELNGEYPQDAVDAGSNLSENERAEAVLAAARAQHEQVQAALERIEQGQYGTCTDCGAPVPEGRLEARPEAARCLDCQAKFDRQQR